MAKRKTEKHPHFAEPHQEDKFYKKGYSATSTPETEANIYLTTLKVPTVQVPLVLPDLDRLSTRRCLAEVTREFNHRTK